MSDPQQELAALLREHGPLIARIARSHESNPARAEELVQDIYVAIWQALPRFRGEANVRTYIARIAQNRAVSHVVREARAPVMSQLDPFVLWTAGWQIFAIFYYLQRSAELARLEEIKRSLERE